MAKHSPLLKIMNELRPHAILDGIKEITAWLAKTTPIWVPYALPLLLSLALLAGVAKLVKKYLVKSAEPKAAPPEAPSLTSFDPASGRLFLDANCECVTTSQADLQVAITHVSNHESQHEYTCFNVRGRLKFTCLRTGEVVKKNAVFITMCDGTIADARPSVSLGMLEEAVLGLTARWRGGLYTISQWPFDPRNENRLRFGEWRVEARISGDDDDRDITLFRVQVHADGSSHWTCEASARSKPLSSYPRPS